MGNQEFGTGKSLAIFGVVILCFALLWPKIFYPMMQTAFAITSAKIDNENSFRDIDRPPHLHPGAVNPRLRNSIASDVEDKFHMREGRPFPHPQARQPVKTQPKSGGAMSIIMPVYTVGIMVFFLYTVLRLVFKKPQENEKKPMIKDFHMDPHYRKLMCEQPSSMVASDEFTSNEVKSEQCELISENEVNNLDEKDYEIYKLKKKLEETEVAMNRIMEHMGAMSACLSGIDKTLPQKENSDVRLRKGNGKQRKGKSKKAHDSEQNEILSEDKRKKLQEDLAKAMLSAAQVTMKSCAEKLTEKPLPKYKDLANSDDENFGTDEGEMNAEALTESSDGDASTDELKMNKKNNYANGCCDVKHEHAEKCL